MTNLDRILKSRDITLPTKVHLVKAVVFPVVVCGCESWTIKKAEHRRIDAFELWCWRWLENRWACKEIQPVHPKGNQSWIFLGKTDAEAEAPILWPPDAKNWLIGKDHYVGKDWRQEEKGMTGWDGWMASLTQWTWVWVDSRSWGWTGRPDMSQSLESQRVGHDWATELNWTELKMNIKEFFLWIRNHRTIKLYPREDSWRLYYYQFFAAILQGNQGLKAWS